MVVSVAPVMMVSPPPTKPCEPPISGGSAASLLRAVGVAATSVDASIGWHHEVLDPRFLKQVLQRMRAREAAPNAIAAWQRAVAAAELEPPRLRRLSTYQDRKRYSSAIADLENALELVAAPFPAYRLGVAFAGGVANDERPESQQWLARIALEPSPFDSYYEEVLIPLLRERDVRFICISLTFQQQAPAAFRLATLLRPRLNDGVRLILGGPLVACWKAVGKPLSGPPFSAFDAVLAGTDPDLAWLATEAKGEPVSVAQMEAARLHVPLAADLSEIPFDHYLSPLPIVPAAFGAGCYWRKCTFCPDHLHERPRPCTKASLGPFLRKVAERFPSGAMLHLTDSALSPGLLANMASTIERERLPLSWHGFVRLEPSFADPEFVALLASGGCSMLQLGVESASDRILDRLGKGSSAARAARILRTTAAAGILNHPYLLFGIPGEEESDRELTLEFVRAHIDSIHAINTALLNLPLGSPMHLHPERYGITALIPFHPDTDLSLYVDFRCGPSHPRLEARRWLEGRFFRDPDVATLAKDLRTPFKANHACFLSRASQPIRRRSSSGSTLNEGDGLKYSE